MKKPTWANRTKSSYVFSVFALLISTGAACADSKCEQWACAPPFPPLINCSPGHQPIRPICTDDGPIDCDSGETAKYCRPSE